MFYRRIFSRAFIYKNPESLSHIESSEDVPEHITLEQYKDKYDNTVRYLEGLKDGNALADMDLNSKQKEILKAQATEALKDLALLSPDVQEAKARDFFVKIVDIMNLHFAPEKIDAAKLVKMLAARDKRLAAAEKKAAQPKAKPAEGADGIRDDLDAAKDMVIAKLMKSKASYLKDLPPGKEMNVTTKGFTFRITKLASHEGGRALGYDAVLTAMTDENKKRYPTIASSLEESDSNEALEAAKKVMVEDAKKKYWLPALRKVNIALEGTKKEFDTAKPEMRNQYTHEIMITDDFGGTPAEDRNPYFAEFMRSVRSLESAVGRAKHPNDVKRYAKILGDMADDNRLDKAMKMDWAFVLVKNEVRTVLNNAKPHTTAGQLQGSINDVLAKNMSKEPLKSLPKGALLHIDHTGVSVDIVKKGAGTYAVNGVDVADHMQQKYAGLVSPETPPDKASA